MIGRRASRVTRSPETDSSVEAHGSEPSSAPRSFWRRGPAPVRLDSPHSADNRIPELDSIRGLACLIILLYHIKPHIFLGGWAAVDLFLILSGYLISSIILKHHQNPGFLRTFYVRRGLRIWPIYYLTLLLIALASPILPTRCNFTQFPYYLTYTQNIAYFWRDKVPLFSPYLTHTWSLAIEEQFYLIWPLLVCLVGRRGIVPLALGLLGLSVSARAAGFHWWLLPARGDGFALGSLLAAMMLNREWVQKHERAVSRALGGASLAGVAYLIPMALAGGLKPFGQPQWPALTVLAINLLSFGGVGLAVVHAGKPSLRFLRRPRLSHLGKISYGLYMYHYVVLVLIDDTAHKLGKTGRPFWRDVVAAVLIYTLAALSWRYVEQPILALKDRFGYGPGSEPSKPRGAHRHAAGRGEAVVRENSG